MKTFVELNIGDRFVFDESVKEALEIGSGLDVFIKTDQIGCGSYNAINLNVKSGERQAFFLGIEKVILVNF